MRLRVVIVAASLIAVMPGLSSALGLGTIQLKSGLNAPLNAEIELIATAEELATLKAQIASRDTFSRYGLDYPAFLTGIQVKIVRAADGRDVISLTSSAPMVEPFATLLVEASWARGRNLREYTVLFDPPVFAPNGSTEAPVASPVTGGGDRSGVVERQPAPAQSPAPAPAPAPTSSSAESSYVVRSGDSLSGIARRTMGEGSSDRALIAIYRANPGAFSGNINELHAGAVLRLPDGAAVAAVDPGEATAEVRRQTAAWSPGSTGGGGSADPRLRLVPPSGQGGSSASSGGAENQALQQRVTQLEKELAESRRLLELRNAELARLQGGVAPAAPRPAAPTPAAPVPAAPAVSPTPEEPVAEAPVPETGVVAEPAPAEPAVAPKPAVAAPAPAPAGPSLLDRLKDYWYIVVGLLVVVGALLALRAARRRTYSFDSALGPYGAAAGAGRDFSSDTFPMRKPVVAQDDRTILVEESGTRERPAFAGEIARTIDFDEPEQSLSATTGTALEQGDPLAEADFHMAYGLYDQAADLVRLAIKREPSRRDLKLKLLEVFFVWGNKDQFLQIARDLADSRDVAEPGEWEKILIMGKQLAPEDALFSATYSGPGPAVDLNLEGGQNHIDFDLHGEPSVEFSSEGGMDLDLGNSGRGRELTDSTARLDFSLDDPSRGNDPLARTATTRQMAQPGFGEETSTQRITAPDGQEGPTVEQPQLPDGGTLRQKIDAQTHFISNDQTAELALDDLGLDLGRLDTTRLTKMDDSRMTRELATPESPTLVAGLDETSRRMISDAQGAHDAQNPTQLMPLGDETDDSAKTSQVPSLGFELGYDVDGSATGKHGTLGDTDFRLDLDVGAAKKPGDSQHVQTQRLGPGKVGEVDPLSADLEPLTMSEVGTKLDLARAYMDMGDPDGARNILNEVLQEGSVSQKQEAQRLIDSIPG